MSSPDLSRSETDAEHDRELLSAARRGDNGAFAQLIERLDPLLFELAAGMLDDEGIDRVLTESYLRAYRAVGRQEGDPLPWLLRITYLNCLAEVRRRERRRVGGFGRLPDREIDSTTSPLGGVAPDERAVLILVDGANLPQEQVAQALEVDGETVRLLLDRARESLDTSADLPVAPVLTHQDDFWANLGQILAAERAAPAVPVPNVPDKFAGSEAKPVEEAATPSLTLRPATAAPAANRKILSRLRRPLAVLVVLGLMAGAVYAALRLGSDAQSPVRSDSVAELARRVDEALIVDQLSARFTRTVVDSNGRESKASYLLLREASGSYLLSTIPGGRAVSYDAATDTRRTRNGGVAGSVGQPAEGAEEAGLAAGPPDSSPGDADLPDVDLDRALRVLREVREAKAEPVIVAGVPAWRLDGTISDATDGGAKQVELLVDRSRLAPMQVNFTSSGRVMRSVQFDQFTLDGTSPGRFAVDLSDLQVEKVDRGFQPVGLSAIAARAGYEPLRPAYLPPGFELARATVRTEGGVVSLRYQTGFRTIVVTTRQAQSVAGKAWDNPFPRNAFEQPAAVSIEEGPFRGVTASRSGSIGSVPSIWGANSELAFSVWGDLDAADLKRVTESLR